jgi:hypothetical protein
MAMRAIDRSEEVLSGEVLTDSGSACVELVPIIQSLRRSPRPRLARPDPDFVAHLIATAAQAPQTRHLRRALLADAQTAYGASQSPRATVGSRTRQVV